MTLAINLKQHNNPDPKDKLQDSGGVSGIMPSCLMAFSLRVL